MPTGVDGFEQHLILTVPFLFPEIETEILARSLQDHLMRVMSSRENTHNVISAGVNENERQPTKIANREPSTHQHKTMENRSSTS